MIAILCVPNSVRAAEISSEFKSYLNKDEKFEFNSSVPSNEEHFNLFIDLYTCDDEMNRNGLSFTNSSANYSEFDLTINSYDENKKETHRVEAQYNYDNKAASKIIDFINTVIKDKTIFEVKDLELVSYYYNRIKNGNNAELIMFLGKLKEALNYENPEFGSSC